MLSDDEIIALIAAADTEYDAGEGGAIWPILFARHVQRAAYERAAQECDEWMKHSQATIGGPLGAYREGKADAASTLAERIRALGRQHD